VRSYRIKIGSGGKFNRHALLPTACARIVREKILRLGAFAPDSHTKIDGRKIRIRRERRFFLFTSAKKEKQAQQQNKKHTFSNRHGLTPLQQYSVYYNILPHGCQRLQHREKTKEDAFFASSFCLGRLFSVNADLLLALRLLLKLNLTVDQSEQSIVRTDTDILAGVNCGASLSDDDIAGDNLLTVRLLYAKALRFAVTAVLGRTDTFFVSKEL
jgi:hypothetical protein